MEIQYIIYERVTDQTYSPGPWGGTEITYKYSFQNVEIGIFAFKDSHPSFEAAIAEITTYREQLNHLDLVILPTIQIRDY